MNDKRRVQRYRVILPALCWGRHRSDFYAVTDDLSVDGIRFKSAVIPAVDETLTCSIRHAGSLNAVVVRTDPASFAVRVLGADHPLGLVVEQLVTLARAQNPPDATRRHRRVVPDKQDVLVTTEAGSMLVGRLLNISASGVAVSLAEPLAVGTVITIGRTQATVARRFDNGIGAAFLVPLEVDTIRSDIVL